MFPEVEVLHYIFKLYFIISYELIFSTSQLLNIVPCREPDIVLSMFTVTQFPVKPSLKFISLNQGEPRAKKTFLPLEDCEVWMWKHT